MSTSGTSVADTNGTTFSEIPIVDLSQAGATEICDICHGVGFFVVVNHGIDVAFLDELFAVMKRLFALPMEQKLLIDKRNSPHFRGWEAEGAEYTNNRPDIREQVDLWTENPVQLPQAEDPAYLNLLGPNQWLSDDVLDGFEATVRRWFDECGDLANRLMALMAEGLGLDPALLSQHFGDGSMSLTKLIHYPPTPIGQAGVNAHHDAGFLTVLAPGPTPGLQIGNPDGEWIDIPQVPGGLVINLGEMLQGMTGNYFVATPHRVITESERYSAGYFHGPTLDTPLTPLPLDPRFIDAVTASPRHADARWMAQSEETSSGVGDIQSPHRPDTYGEQLWNYFSRSYPDNMARFYG